MKLRAPPSRQPATLLVIITAETFYAAYVAGQGTLAELKWSIKGAISWHIFSPFPHFPFTPTHLHLQSIAHSNPFLAARGS